MSLSEIYSIAKLPRVSRVLEKIKVSRDSDSEELHVGISGASISSYVLKPSPKLIWSHTIPPSYSITSFEKIGDLYITGIYNISKKLSFVQIIEKLENDSKVLKEIDFDSNVINIKVFESSIVIISENSIFALDKNSYDKVWEVSNLYKAIYSEFIENEVILVVEHDAKKHNSNFKLLNTEGVEINSRIIENSDEGKFVYTGGKLIQYSNGLLEELQLPHFQQTRSLSISAFGIKEDKRARVSIDCPANDRLLLSQGKKIYLINTKFTTLLDTKESKHPIENIMIIEKKFKTSRFNNLFSIISREGDIAGITFSLDSNTLKDALGKKHRQISPMSYHSVPSIFDIKEENIDVAKLLKSKKFDQDVLKFLNAKNEYYTENDKIIDAKFMNAIVDHALKQNELPEKLLTYLLTHPLFPCVNGLLTKLRPNSRLLRQAIVTSNLTAKELFEELNTTDNDEIFKDVITRLLEFPKDQLDFKDLDSYKIVERIIELNFGFELVSLLIDASGLLTWGEDLIESLQEVVTKKINALNGVSNTLTVIERLESKNVKPSKKIPLYSIETLKI